MDDLSKLLINSGIGCFIDNVCFNHVFYADDLCLMAPCALALQELLNICHSYSISVDVNFNSLKSFCIRFTPKLFKLSLPKININSAHIPYTDSIKYLGFTFTSNHKDDNDIIRQMRILYARSNRIVRLFHSCSSDVLLELGRSFCGSVAFHISLYTFILHYVTIHAFHNIQYMYHFTHDYKHRLHTRMQAIARTYNTNTHTHVYHIIMHRPTHVLYYRTYTHSVHNTHLYSSQTDCGITSMLN